MVIAEVRIIPIGTETASLSKYVARAVSAVKGEGDVRYQLTATGTILEGALDSVLAVVRKMHEATFDGDVARVITMVEIDDRRDREVSMEARVEAVQRELA